MPDVTTLHRNDPQTAGPYRLVGRLGAGGQGIVYLGKDEEDRLVAVKMIGVDWGQHPKAKPQFAKEIAAARRVAPFCTAQILFADVDSETPYVVSEYIEGPTLQRQVREQGPITGNALHRLAVGTATALAAIHQAGVVHCDFKPDNVILGADGPRVIDFGIARALDVAETLTGRVMGTAPYMAPERFRNDEVGSRCDVFAWAATIAFAAAGRAPFGHDGIAIVMNRILNEPPDLEGLSGSLDELIRDCLRKDQYARPPAEQVLLRLLGHSPRPAATLPLEKVLQEGSDAATSFIPSHPLPRLPLGGQAQSPVAVPVPPTRAQPLPQSQPLPQTLGQPSAFPVVPGLPDRAKATAPVTVPVAPVQPQAPVPATAPGPAYDAGSRLRREIFDAWGVSLAIFLGAVGGAVAYAASAKPGPAAAAGGAAFAVVYGVRLLTALVITER